MLQHVNMLGVIYPLPASPVAGVRCPDTVAGVMSPAEG